MKLPTLMGARSFAHLAGLARPNAAKAESDEDENRKDKDDAKKAESDDPEKDDDDKKKGKRADSDSPDDDDEKKDAKRAEDDSDDEYAENDDPDGDEDDQKDSKKAKGYAAGMKAAAAHAASVLGAKEAASFPALAADLASDPSIPTARAIALLKTAALGSPTSNALAGRSSRNPSLGNGGEPSQTGRQAAVQSWDAAFSRVVRK